MSTTKLPKEEMVLDLQRAAEDLGRTPTREEIDDFARRAGSTYENRFESWNAAVRAAGLTPNNEHNVDRECCNCDNCGEEFHRRPSKVNNSGFIYCSWGCWVDHSDVRNSGPRNPAWDGGMVTVECANCGNDVERKPAEVRTNDNAFCNYSCSAEWKSEHLSGENHHRWKGGKFKYYGPNWPQQRDKALERDGYVCQDCGISEDECLSEYGFQLDVHHIVPLREFKTGGNGVDYESANQLENLITLCRSCHRTRE